MASRKSGISSESHHVRCARNAPVAAETTITAAPRIHPARRRVIAAARKQEYGTARMDIHLHGNCTKRSLNTYSQKTELGRIIMKIAAAERNSSTRHSFLASSVSSFLAVLRRAAILAIPVITISTTATLEAIQLSTLCSGSFVLV